MKHSSVRHQHNGLVYPVEIVLSPSWWYKHAGISFDEDFFYMWQ